ncbi:hypothetical protein DFP72DRAFT_892836 [Ephemerocybe angulata]|uniref:Uncharacterized protein n=1 Tax=Ephemerocybe angulata TaxID=980116 RepID=A0A8H6I2Z4_9AGAR|nr:hypothetical protein DFP72DRAFT_892836 [Tulosesus angulatus]
MPSSAWLSSPAYLALVLLSSVNLVILLQQWRLYHPYVDPRDIYNRLPGHFESTAMTLNHTRIQVQGDADTPTWRALAHNGFIRLGEEGLNFDVSMYHQLHCLNQIRTSYNSGVSAFATSVARSESNGSSVIAAGNRTHVADDDMAVKHSGHCFQYILHALICRADPGLIPISSDEMAKTPDIAEGHTYQCRDWVPVRRTVTENHAKWKGVPYT